MVDAFTFPGIGARVIFGHGTLAQVADEIEARGKGRALVLSTPGQEADARALSARLGAASAGVFAGAAMHTPTDVTQRALEAYRASGAGVTLALGGGSTIGLGKAIAVRTGADQIAVPTTYAGSEMTDILGETEGGEKTTRRAPEIRPEVVIYDVDLTLSLPPAMTVTSALNAVAHSAEALYAADRNPILTLMAGESFARFREALPRVVADAHDAEARAGVLYAAWLSSTTLGYVAMGLHHKLAHVVGGTAGTPHAETHAILLPHTIGFNARAVPDLLAPIDAAFGDTPGRALHAFARDLGAPARLADLGVAEAQLDGLADLAVRTPYANPRPFGRADIRALLQAAWEGAAPEY